MSKYRELIQNPPNLFIKQDSREIIFRLVSCMCDNKYTFKLKKNEEGDYKLNTCGFAYSNFQIKYPEDEIEWAADENNFHKVIGMINSGTSKIELVKST